jgi:CrcB protein
MRLVLLACAGGAIGAGARFVIAEWFAEHGWATFPWSTLVVNVTGSALMGLVVGLLALRVTAAPELRIFLATGVLGGYTTFSAYSLDAWLLAERGHWGAAALYVFGSVVLSIAGLGAGLYIARSVIS